MLLSGPPGCGKTLLGQGPGHRDARSISSPSKGRRCLSKYVGESEKAVREVFHKARQAAPCIVFFDEIDALVAATRRRRVGWVSWRSASSSQFLTELDGVEELKGVLVLAATNRPDMLDPALLRPGRFDIQIEVPPPDREDRSEIFAIGLRGKPVAGDIDLDVLAERTDGFSGAELQAVCRRAALDAIREVVASNGKGAAERQLLIRRDQLEQAVDDVPAQGK